MPTRSEAIKNFLEIKSPPDLAKLYSLHMECQVNVAQDGGERVSGEFKGRSWMGWTDGLTTWKSFRIPHNAGKTPHYKDKEIRFDLASHAEGIGMTGWDWHEKVSKWVAYDFDAIMGHSEKHLAKLTNEELTRVKNAALEIDWVTVRKSSGGKGLHLYVFLPDIPTSNHHEHAALSRSILGKMSALSGFDFSSKVDICGGNMWVWHRKCLNTDGFALIKPGNIMPLFEIPPNWKDHIKVVTRKTRRNLPQDISNASDFEDLAGQHPCIPLDDEHRKLIEYLKTTNCLWWWDQDHHMLVTHTFHLKKAHEDLSLKGYFDTESLGKNKGHDHNCFLFPMRKGAWSVRRFSPGVQESASWEQDGAGWTRCYLNRVCDLGTAARAFGGVEDPDGSFIFSTAEQATQAAQLLGVHINIGTPQNARAASLKPHKDGRIIVKVERQDKDDGADMEGWNVKKGEWIRIHGGRLTTPPEPEVINYDHLVRHLVTESNEDFGWMVNSDGIWKSEPLTHVRVALSSLGFTGKEVTNILGSSIFKCWTLMNSPFQPEYPGNRQWNRHAAQLKFPPTQEKDDLEYPTWTRILEHCGAGLDDAVKNNSWAKANGILTGGDYLKCWVASLFQEPLAPLPYLFFYGPQNSGKSIFHEALNLLLTKGYKRADAALVSQSGFNGELEGSIICVVEETDLRGNKTAYNRIKDWVTSLELLIHRKGRTPYHIPNSTHWIQCANEHTNCPMFNGDTRITMCYVKNLDPLKLIPKKKLIPILQKEAPDFISEIINLELPPSPDRLNIPIIESSDKKFVQESNLTPIESFIKEECILIEGRSILYKDFYTKYLIWAEINGEAAVGKKRFGKTIPPQHPKGRMRGTGQFHLGNIWWKGEKPSDSAGSKWILRGDYLERS